MADSQHLRVLALKIFADEVEEAGDGALRWPNQKDVARRIATEMGVAASDSSIQRIVRQVKELTTEATRVGAYRK